MLLLPELLAGAKNLDLHRTPGKNPVHPETSLGVGFGGVAEQGDEGLVRVYPRSVFQRQDRELVVADRVDFVEFFVQR